MDDGTVKQRIKPKPSLEPEAESPQAEPKDDGALKCKIVSEFETSSDLNDKIYQYTFIPRVILAAMWPMCMFYVSYLLYLDTTDPKFDSFHNKSRGIFTNITGRGKDVNDNLWRMLSEDFLGKCYLWYGFYGILARLIQIYAPKALPMVSALISFAFIPHLTEFSILILLLSVLLVFWIVQQLNSKLALWLTFFGYLYLLTSYHLLHILPESARSVSFYFFVSVGWCLTRCISFYCDTWNRPNRKSLSSLCTCVLFCFYFPLAVWGPLDSFENYEKYILIPSKLAKSRGIAQREFLRMIVKLGRFTFWTLFNELLLHFLYFKMLSRHPEYLETINYWALIAILHWLGHFIQLTYNVMYGIPGAIAEADGLPMLASPKCIMRIHRYSILWKNIDRGMYIWFIRYVYNPVLEIITRVDRGNKLSPAIRRILASVLPFVFISNWHSLYDRMLIWASLNFFCVTAERIGGFLKDKIDAKYKIPPAIWEVFVEPVVTIPFLVISCITSSLYSASLETAKVMAYRIPTEGYYYTPILLTFTHLGVLVETWPKVRRAVFRRQEDRRED